MHAIGGSCRLDGGAADRGVVGRMNRAAQLVRPHQRNCWFSGPVGLASAGPRISHGNQRQPRCDESRGCALVFDGRLDNRTELIAALSGYPARTQGDDLQLTLAAYEAWGDDCASRLIGDFAFGLWDAARRRLLCVRDPLGVRPLYTCTQDKVVCFATQLRQIVAACRQTPPLDLEFVADRLAFGTDRADSGSTPYRGVTRLRPGHRLIAENGRVRTERYWTWRSASGDASRDGVDHVERFRQVFADAVESRMRGPGVVWSDLSGGLDSSSIASVAAGLRAGRALPTVSVVFSESTLSDEREWMEIAARDCGVERHFIDGDSHHPFSGLREAVRYWEEPHGAAAFFGVHRQYGRLMGSDERPVLLSGIGAEAVVMSKTQTPVHLADLLRQGRLAALWRELDRWQRVLKVPLSNLVSRFCLRPLASQALMGSYLLPRVHDWITPSFARRWDLRGRARSGNMTSACRGVADRWQIERIGAIPGLLLRGYLDKACDIRYPFLHRPLVELVLDTPWDVKEIPGEPKALLRRAMRGVLSEDIRRRTVDVSTGHAVYAGVRKEWRALQQIVESSLLVDVGIVDRDRLHDALHLARQGHALDLPGLLSTLTLDVWLQHAVHEGDTEWLTSAA